MNIVIVGAGIGGLTLGNLLQQSGQNIHFQIFERDADAHSRSQGYSITLREPGGLTALRQLGLYDEVKNMGSAVVNFPFLTQTGSALLNLRDNPASPRTLRVPRDKLRDLLLRNIQGNVYFNTPCSGFTEQAGKPVVGLANERKESADLVVACDGVNSVIRQQMLGDAPHYLGIASISGSVTPSLDHALLVDGSFMMIGNAVALFVVNENDVTAWSLSMRAQKDEFETIPKSVLKERAIGATRDWHAPIPEIIAHTDPDSLVTRGYYDKSPLTSVHHGNIVLLGDAAHPMSPFRGEGANMAMLDALSLTKLLTDSAIPPLGELLSRYEKEMIPRSRKAVSDSRMAALEIHTSNPFRQAVRNAKWRMADKILPLVQKT